jgi:general secretion pathway protein D
MLGRRIRLFAGSLAVLLSLSCGGGSSAFRAGRKAELRKDFDTALINYQKALNDDPANAQYQLYEKLARKEAAFFHIKQGRSLLQQGRTEDAAGEFQKAVSIDPTSETAAQELSKLQATQAQAHREREQALKQALKAQEPQPSPTQIQLKPFPTEPIAHLRLTADSRKIYETLGKLASLNVAFTSDFQPKPLSVDLTNVKIGDALRIVSYQTKTFWKAATPNTILVIPDTPGNRRDYEQEVVRTIYLTNPLAPADRTAITTALKQVLGVQRIIDNPDANAIVLRDTPSKVAAAEKMVRELDRSKAEILIEVSVMEADRDRIRELGLLPATQFGLTPTPNLTTGLAIKTVRDIGHLSGADYSLTMPSAALSALLNDSKTRILQNPKVRVTDGQTAKLRIGSRVPYATGSFLPGTGGGGGGFNLLASTQFQYQDVGVNLDLAPRLLPSGEVSLHAIVEISDVGPSVNLGGLSQPTFTQRKIEHDIRLKEGESSLLGGLIANTEKTLVTGIPGLGDIPVLRYLFSVEKREVITTEFVVTLTPRVVRLPASMVESAKEVPVEGGGPEPAPEAPPAPEAGPRPPGPPE